MRSIVSFLVEHDDTTCELDHLIENVTSSWEVIDHEVRVDVADDDHLDRLLESITWNERARLDAGNPLLDAANEAIALNAPIESWVTCGHFDAMADPSHDCSNWS